ncbi:MAG: hypothetical protein ACI9VI_003249 [Candidatus Azotimanducaceae bacterium]|jgi:hypothetical protein
MLKVVNMNIEDANQHLKLGDVMIRLNVLFHDADGCLNPIDGHALSFEPGSLSSADVAALAELGRCVDKSGLDHLVLNTGRSWIATRFLCHHIASKKLKYALVEHGSALWDVLADREVNLAEVALESSHPRAHAALSSAKKINLLIRWFERVGSRELCRRMGYEGQLETALDKTSNLTFFLPPELDGDVVVLTLKELIASHEVFGSETLVYHHSRWNRFVDVMGTMDKGIGLSITMDYPGFKVEQAAAIGDGLNDIPMLQTAAFPICPANAEDEVKQLCRDRGYVSSSSYIGASLDWLAKYGGMRNSLNP